MQTKLMCEYCKLQHEFCKKRTPQLLINRITIFKNGMKQQIKPRARFNPKLEKKLPYYCCCLVGRSVDLETTFFLFFHTYLYFIWNYVFVPITRLSRQAFFGSCLETNQKVRLIWDEKYPLSSCLIVCYFEMI